MRAQSDSRNAMVLATGSGSFTSHFNGARAAQPWASRSNPGMLLAAMVRTGPAETQFTRIAYCPRYRARYLVIDSSAALLTPIQSYTGHATRASKSMLTTDPPF